VETLVIRKKNSDGRHKAFFYFFLGHLFYLGLEF
jgi:hypothetical protein